MLKERESTKCEKGWIYSGNKMNLISSPCDPNWTGCCYDTKRDDTTFGFVFFDFSMKTRCIPLCASEEVSATRWQQSLLINKETAALREHFSCSKNTLSSSFPKLNVCYQSNMATDISHLCTVGA